MVAGVTLATLAPATAGDPAVSVSGTASCNEATGEHTITWTITNTGQGSPTVTATQTPPGSVLTVVPNPVPSPGQSTAQSTLPGSTVGVVQLSVAVVGGPTAAGQVTLTACTQAVVAVEAPPRTVG